MGGGAEILRSLLQRAVQCPTSEASVVRINIGHHEYDVADIQREEAPGDADGGRVLEQRDPDDDRRQISGDRNSAAIALPPGTRLRAKTSATGTPRSDCRHGRSSRPATALEPQ